MSQACPLLYRQVDGTLSRINAFSVSAVLVLFLSTSQPLWLYLLGADFLIRLYGRKTFSPIYIISMGVKQLFRLSANMTDAGAKRLAGHMGISLVVLLLISSHMDLKTLELVLAVVFLLCASLEWAFDYCIGCKIYYIVKKISGMAV